MTYYQPGVRTARPISIWDVRLSRDMTGHLCATHVHSFDTHTHTRVQGRTLRCDQYALGISFGWTGWHVEIFDWRRSSSQIHWKSMFTPDGEPVSSPATSAQHPPSVF